jgi:hypothetical protein
MRNAHDTGIAPAVSRGAVKPDTDMPKITRLMESDSHMPGVPISAL